MEKPDRAHPMNPVLAAIQKQILQSAASSLNITLDDVLADLGSNAPRRTGALDTHYKIAQKATAESLQGQITNSQPYSGYQYPYRLYIPSPKHPASYPTPSLFSPPPSGAGVIDPAKVGTDKIAQLLQVNVQKQLKAAFG